MTKDDKVEYVMILILPIEGLMKYVWMNYE